MSVDHRDLIVADMAVAASAKHDRGKELHGEDWVGPRPLVCLHDELLDAYVYANLEYVRGEVDRKVLQEIMFSLINVRRGVQTLLKQIPSDEWDGWDR